VEAILVLDLAVGIHAKHGTADLEPRLSISEQDCRLHQLTILAEFLWKSSKET
jgi:hypothetical protein